MKAFRLLIPVVLAVFALGITARALDDVQTDYDKKADFSKYKTYSWIKVQTSDPLWEPRIKDAVDTELQAKGFQKVDTGGDLAVAAVGSARDQQEYTTFYNGMGPWWWRGFGSEATTTVTNYRIGTLVLDMYDANNHRLIWRGTASDMLSNKPSKNEKKLDKVVAKMFDKFPPKTNKE